MFGGKKVYYDFQQYREEAPEREKQQQERIRAKFMEIVDCLVSEGGQKHFFSIDKSGGMEISSTNPGTSKSITIAPIGSSREFAMKTILEAVEFLSKKK